VKETFDIVLETNCSDEIGELTNTLYMVHELKSMISGISTASVDLQHSAEHLVHHTQDTAKRETHHLPIKQACWH
jgi:hypothetical protein